MKRKDLKLGDRICFTHKMVRTNLDHNTRYWKKTAFKEFQEGIYIGFRTISDGDRTAGISYKPINHRAVALVVTDERSKPIYVPFNAIEGKYR